MQNSTADYIDQLPVDQTQSSQEETEIIDTIFKFNKNNSQKDVNKVLSELKDPLIVALLVTVVLFFKPNIENFICQYSPKIGSSQFLVNFVIAFMCGFIFYFLKNINLVIVQKK